MRFKPLFDKLTWLIFIPTVLLLIAATVLTAPYPIALLCIMLPVDIFTLYFLITPFFGYVELREEVIFVKFGFIMKREIPYGRIRGMSLERKFYSDSMLSLKGALEHVNIKYNRFDLISVSVRTNDALIDALNERISNKIDTPLRQE
jgi:hypothetical protein